MFQQVFMTQNTPSPCHICRAVGVVRGISVGIYFRYMECLGTTLTPQTTPTARHIWQSHGAFGLYIIHVISDIPWASRLGVRCCGSSGEPTDEVRKPSPHCRGPTTILPHHRHLEHKTQAHLSLFVKGFVFLFQSVRSRHLRLTRRR